MSLQKQQRSKLKESIAACRLYFYCECLLLLGIPFLMIQSIHSLVSASYYLSGPSHFPPSVCEVRTNLRTIFVESAFQKWLCNQVVLKSCSGQNPILALPLWRCDGLSRGLSSTTCCHFGSGNTPYYYMPRLHSDTSMRLDINNAVLDGTSKAVYFGTCRWRTRASYLQIPGHSTAAILQTLRIILLMRASSTRKRTSKMSSIVLPFKIWWFCGCRAACYYSDSA